MTFISNEWVEGTWTKHQVDLAGFCNNWVSYFYDNNELWPSTHKRKSSEPYIEYDYDHKQKNNLFNLDSLYRRMPKKPFTKGKKQEFEILMMYYWLHSIVGDDDNYWQEYAEKTLPGLSRKMTV